MSNETVHPLYSNGHEMITTFLELGHVQHVMNVDDGDGKRARTDATGAIQTGLDPVTIQKRATLDSLRQTYGSGNVVVSLPLSEAGEPDATNYRQIGVYITAAAVWNTEAAQIAAGKVGEQAQLHESQFTPQLVAA